jgi:hypothetical protein
MSANPQSILDSIKKVLGVDSEDEAFDIDIIMHINTVFGSLQQLGVGPITGFVIIDNTLLWSNYSPNMTLLAAVKSYVASKVRLIFDPPATSFAIDAIQKLCAELEWRLNIMAEQITPPSDPFNPGGGGDVVVQAYWWDLTGLSDFPDEAAIGDLGVNLTTGNVYRNE